MDFGVVKGEWIVPVFSVSGPDDQPLLEISGERQEADLAQMQVDPGAPVEA